MEGGAQHIGPYPHDRPFLSLEETAQLFGVKYSRAHQMATSGLIPMVRLGRRILVPRKGIEAMIDAALETERPRD